MIKMLIYGKSYIIIFQNFKSNLTNVLDHRAS